MKRMCYTITHTSMAKVNFFGEKIEYSQCGILRNLGSVNIKKETKSAAITS